MNQTPNDRSLYDRLLEQQSNIRRGLSPRRLPRGGGSATGTKIVLGVTSSVSTDASGINPRTLGQVAVWKYSLDQIGPPAVMEQTTAEIWYYWGAGDIPAFASVIGAFIPEIQQTVIIEVYQAEHVSGRFMWYKLANPLSAGNDPNSQYTRMFLTRRSSCNTDAFPDSDVTAANAWAIVSPEGEYPDLPSSGNVNWGMVSSDNATCWAPDRDGQMTRWDIAREEFEYVTLITSAQGVDANIDNILAFSSTRCLTMDGRWSGQTPTEFTLLGEAGIIERWDPIPGTAPYDETGLTQDQWYGKVPCANTQSCWALRDYGSMVGSYAEFFIGNLSYFSPSGLQSGVRFTIDSELFICRGKGNLRYVPSPLTEWTNIHQSGSVQSTWEIIVEGNNIEPTAQECLDYWLTIMQYGVHPTDPLPTWPYTTVPDPANGNALFRYQSGEWIRHHRSAQATSVYQTPSMHYETGSELGNSWALRLAYHFVTGYQHNSSVSERHLLFLGDGITQYHVSSSDPGNQTPASLRPDSGIVVDMKGGGGWVGCWLHIESTNPVGEIYGVCRHTDATPIFKTDVLTLVDHPAGWNPHFNRFGIGTGDINPTIPTRQPLLSCSDYHFYVTDFEITDSQRISELTNGNYTRDDFLAGESHEQMNWILPKNGKAATPCIDGAVGFFTENTVHEGTVGDTNKAPGPGTPPIDNFMPDQPFGVKPST